MKNNHLLISALAFILISTAISCKKVDLVKVAVVKTMDVSSVCEKTNISKIYIIDPGEGHGVSQGVCYSTSIANPELSNSTSTVLYQSYDNKTFYGLVNNLNENTHYYLRAYFQNSQEVVYGDVIEFTTQQSYNGNYLFYDDGANYNSVGLSGGGNFRAAIRFYNDDLPQGNITITKLKLFLNAKSAHEYSIMISTIENGMVFLQYEEPISTPLSGAYAEYSLSTPFVIPSSGIDGIYAGYSVIDPIGGYPAGVDRGPIHPSANSNLVLTEGSPSWERLTDYGLQGNWNIQVYAVNSRGEEIILKPKNTFPADIRTEMNGDPVNKNLSQLPVFINNSKSN